MTSRLLILSIGFLMFGCEGDRGTSPVLPEVLEFGAGDAIPENPEDPAPAENPDDQGASENPNEPDPDGDGNSAGELQELGLRLEVTAVDQLPQRVAECVQKGMAGEVINGIFTCNQRLLIDCNSLSEPQKQVAKAYAEEQLPGYGLYGCSNSSEANPNLHYFMVDGVALRIFNLEVQPSLVGGL